MLRKFSLFTLVAIISAIILYVYYFNSESVKLSISSTEHYTVPLALIIVSSFLFGVFVLGISLIALGIRTKLNIWKLTQKLEDKTKHLLEVDNAKDLIAIGNINQAELLLEKLLNKDNRNIVTRDLLAEAYARDDEKTKALGILETVRAEEKRSPSLLLKLADIYEELGNLSAAYDNINLALQNYPKSIPLLKRSIDLTRKLGKIDEALTLAKQLYQVCTFPDQKNVKNLIASISFDKLGLIPSSEKANYEIELNKILKEFKDFEPAILEAAKAHLRGESPDHGLKLLKKLVYNNHSVNALQILCNYHLEVEDPGSTVSLLEDVIQKVSSLKLSSSLLLLQVYIYLEAAEKARDLLLNIETQNQNLSSEILEFLEVLKVKIESKSLIRAGQHLSLDKLVLKTAIKYKLPHIVGKVLNPALSVEQLKLIEPLQQNLRN